MSILLANLAGQLIFGTLVGLATGILTGGLGLGGGVILVPFLLTIFTQAGFDLAVSMRVAVATSLGCIACSSLASVFAHTRKKAASSPRLVDTQALLRMAPMGVTGLALATWLQDQVSPRFLLLAFSALLVFVALRIWRQEEERVAVREAPRHPLLLLAAAGFGAGFLGTLVGVGGGIIAVPALHLVLRKDFRQAVATSTGLIAILASISTALQIYVGCRAPLSEQLPQTWGYVSYFWLAAIVPVGILTAHWVSRNLHRLPRQALRQSFAVVALLIALRLTLRALGG